MKQISVVMSTYNGQKYLEEQIESIQKQDGIGIDFSLHLYVRDDKSSDDTLKIVSKFPNLTLIHNVEKNIGVKASFFTLLRNVPDSELIFFSDQDDIWPKNKVEKFLDVYDQLAQTEKDRPIGIFSDLWIADADGNSIGKKMSEIKRWAPESDYHYLSWNYMITGAAFAINNASKYMAMTISPEVYEKINMHDSFIALLISVTGKLVEIDEPLLMYRQHSSNVLGANKKQGVYGEISSAFKSAIRLYQDDIYAYEWMLENRNQFPENVGAMDYFRKIYVMSSLSLIKRISSWRSMLKYMLSLRLPFTTFYLYVLNMELKNKFWRF